MAIPTDLVRVDEAASILGITKNTLQKWRHEGRRSQKMTEIPGHYKRGKVVLYSVSELIEYIERTTVRAALASGGVK